MTMSVPLNLLASLLRTIAIIGGIWTILMLLFCIVWSGLMRMVRKAEHNLFSGEQEKHLSGRAGAEEPPPAQNVIEWHFPNPTPEDVQRQRARR